MTKEETDLIIAEQNKSTEEILKAVAKIKADYHELCNLKDMRIAKLEAQIEKMKCCGNCVHFDFTEPNYCHKGVYRANQNVCGEWCFGN